MAIDKKAVGRRLATLRGSRTQQEVADALGISPQAVSMYERGERMPTDETKLLLAEYYKRSVKSLFFAD